MTMQLMETHRRKPSFTQSDVALTVVTVRAQWTSRWWLICEYHRTHSEKIHRRKKESLNMLFFFFFHESVTITSDNIPTNWGHTSFSYEIALLFIKCVKAEITYFFRVLLNVDDSGRRHDHWFIVDAAEGIFFVRDTLTARVLFFLKRHLPAVVTSICTPRSSAWSQVATLSTTARRGSFTGVLMTIYSNSHWNDAASPQIAKSSAAVWQQVVINSLFSRQQTLLHRFILSTIF